MRYLSFRFLILVLLTLAAYYLPALVLKRERSRGAVQRAVLLCASLAFYYLAGTLRGCCLFAATVIVSWALGLLLDAAKGRRGLSRLLFVCSLLLCLAPLLLIKTTPLFAPLNRLLEGSLIVPLGVSFYTLQIVAYLCDCRSGRTEPERSLFRYALFVSYFPQIVQGPIPRHKALAAEFARYHSFEPEEFVSGFQRVLWGCFLKLMIADKAALAVDRIYGAPAQYGGGYVLIAMVLYCVQLYTDFYSCVSICRGVSELFGVRLQENFRQPFLARSIREYWQRWHISLSTWLRDYVYIPLGGSRKGTLRTCVNLLLVFLVSGLWHGSGYQFLFWGLLHGVYLVLARLSAPLTKKLTEKLRIRTESFGWGLLMRVKSFALVAFAYHFFRADGLRTALRMLRSLFSSFTPWLFFGSAAFSYGLDVYDWVALLASVLVLIAAGVCRERRVPVRAAFNRQHLILRWFVYLLVICVIWVFGTYGFGYNAADYIYGGF